MLIENFSNEVEKIEKVYIKKSIYEYISYIYSFQSIIILQFLSLKINERVRDSDSIRRIEIQNEVILSSRTGAESPVVRALASHAKIMFSIHDSADKFFGNLSRIF